MSPDVFRCEFVKCHPEAKIPDRAHLTDVGYDLHAIETQILGPGMTAVVPLGFRMTGRTIFYAQIFSRSGLASRGIFAQGGVIDPGYTGEWKVVLYNSSRVQVTIRRHDAVAQAVFLMVCRPTIVEVSELSNTGRGVGGFGSTDQQAVEFCG